MDFLYHAATGLVISKAVTGNYELSAVLFAMLPDLIGAVPHSISQIENSDWTSPKIFLRSFFTEEEKNAFYFPSHRRIYRTTHSLFFWGLLTAALWVFNRNQALMLSVSYISHILIDIPTHEGEFSQRVFYPLSDWHIVGKGWALSKNMYILFWILLFVIFGAQRISAY